MNLNDDKMHPQDFRNMIIFVAAALAVWFIFDVYLLKPKMEQIRAAKQAEIEAQKTEETAGAAPEIFNTPEERLEAYAESRREALTRSPRVKIENPRLTGSIALRGGLLDDITLKNYYVTKDSGHHVNVLSPLTARHTRYTRFGWLSREEGLKLPGDDTIWRVAGNGNPVLTPDNPVTLYWDNGQGLRFERRFAIDENFLVTLTQRVINKSDREITLFPFALIAERGLPDDLFGRWIVHEGPIGYIGGELHEYSFKKMKKEGEKTLQSDEGWIGITERYWHTTMIPAWEGRSKYRFNYTPAEKADEGRYQVDVTGPGLTLASGESAERGMHVYAGAKKVEILEAYGKELDIRHMDLAVDFGLFYFLSKPIYHMLLFFGDLTGNYGIGIILITIIIRIAVFPLANTSYRSFAKLKQVAPQMKELREKYGDDKEKLQSELVKLYEKEKVNPMAGCLPLLMQIPIFFSIYKALQISLEIRHAPFFGWIQDLSAPDPTTIFNLFGLLPYGVPDPLMIGAWPCLMLFFMLLQKQLHPPAQDKMQAAMMLYMPFMMTYILAKFASGLVIYWTFSNALSVLQQYILMRSMGVEVHLFKRSKEEEEMEEAVRKGPDVHPELGVIEDEVEKALFDDPLEIEKEAGAEISPPKPKKKQKKKR